MLEEAGSAPLLLPLLLPVVPVPEGPELLLVLLGVPEPELLEPPEPPLVLAGGARERKIGYVNYENEPGKNSLPGVLTSNLGPVA